jgi:hypothetical protein
MFIITLSSSTAPMALEAPAMPELIGLAVFRSRRIEDGRDRFRLHIGYFDSVAAAEAVLPAVRKHFPAAWVGPAPQSGMGSLDDTTQTQFKFIKAPNTLQRDPSIAARPAPLPAAATPASLPKPPLSRQAVPKPVATPSPRPVATQQPRPVATQAGKAARPGKPARPARSSQQAARRNDKPARVKQQPELPPREVLLMLESSQLPRTASNPQAVQPHQRAAVIGAIQRFAVQIVWSMDPVDLANVPKLAIFDAYTLYKVQVDRAGRRWYGLRLGFFADPVSARQVALYARSDFSAAAVVPVSDRECERAAQAAITAFPAAETAKKAEAPVTLFEEKPAAEPRVQGRTTPQPRAAGKKKPASRAKSTQELADELQLEPDFAGSDPLSDTGVRHLAIQIVKPRSGLGALFSRKDKRD